MESHLFDRLAGDRLSANESLSPRAKRTMMRRRVIGSVFLSAASATFASAQTIRPITLGTPTELHEVEFARATGIRELSDGRLLVADALEKQLHLVDFARRAALGLGREGSGPGEYKGLGQLIALPGDTTLVIDTFSGRWLMMVRDSFVSVISGDHPAMAGGRNPLGADARGNLLGSKAKRNFQGVVGSINTGNDSAIAVRVDRRTGRLDTLVTYKTRPSRIVVRGTPERPTSVSITMNPVSAGEQLVMFADGAVAVARLNPYRVDWLIDGRRIRGSPLPTPTIPLSREEKLAALARLPGADEDKPRQPEDVTDWPETMPPFLSGASLAAPDGSVWIRRAPTLRDPGTEYDVVDRTGRLSGRVQLARNEVIAGFGKSSVYVLVTDDDGLQRLRKYPRSPR